MTRVISSKQFHWPTALLITATLVAVACREITTTAAVGKSSLAREWSPLESKRGDEAAANRAKLKEEVRQLHERGLAFALSALQAEKQKHPLQAEDVLRIAKKACKDFMHDNDLPDGCAVFDRTSAQGPLHSVMTLPGAASVTRYEGMESLSTAAQGYLNRIDVASQTYADVSSLDVVLDQIESEASSNLSGDELEIVLGVSSVASGSSSYWTTYGPDWDATYGGGACTGCPERTSIGVGFPAGNSIGFGPRQTLTVPTSPYPKYSWSWTHLRHADEAGAVGGGIAAAVTGGGIVVGLVGGAVAVSIYEGAMMLLE